MLPPRRMQGKAHLLEKSQIRHRTHARVCPSVGSVAIWLGLAVDTGYLGLICLRPLSWLSTDQGQLLMLLSS